MIKVAVTYEVTSIALVHGEGRQRWYRYTIQDTKGTRGGIDNLYSEAHLPGLLGSTGVITGCPGDPAKQEALDYVNLEDYTVVCMFTEYGWNKKQAEAIKEPPAGVLPDGLKYEGVVPGVVKITAVTQGIRPKTSEITEGHGVVDVACTVNLARGRVTGEESPEAKAARVDRKKDPCPTLPALRQHLRCLGNNEGMSLYLDGQAAWRHWWKIGLVEGDGHMAVGSVYEVIQRLDYNRIVIKRTSDPRAELNTVHVEQVTKELNI